MSCGYNCSETFDTSDKALFMKVNILSSAIFAYSVGDLFNLGLSSRVVPEPLHLGGFNIILPQ